MDRRLQKKAFLEWQWYLDLGQYNPKWMTLGPCMPLNSLENCEPSSFLFCCGLKLNWMMNKFTVVYPFSSKDFSV